MKLSFFVLAFLILVGCQDLGFNNTASNNSKLENQMSTGHVCVPGTQVCLNPPPGFTQSGTFPGFEHDTINAIIVVTKAPFSFFEARKGFAPSQLRKMGFDPLYEKEVRLGGKEGLFQTMKHAVPNGVFVKHILTFGDDSSFISINAAFPVDHANKLDEALKECLLQTVYDPSATWDIEESMPFEILTERTELTSWFGMGNGLSYVIDGDKPEDSHDGVVVALMASMGRTQVENRKEFALENIEVYASVSNTAVDSIAQVEIDGMKGYEIVAHGMEMKTHLEAIVHEVFLFSEHYFYVIGSRATDHLDENLAMFRKVSRTFRRKYRNASNE